MSVVGKDRAVVEGKESISEAAAGTNDSKAG